MNKMILGAIVVGAGLTVTVGYCARTAKEKMLSEQISSVEQVKQLFLKSPDEIREQADRYLKEAQQAIDAIITIPHAERTFANTAQALSDLCSRSNIAVKSNFFEMVEYVYPDKQMRDSAHEVVQKVEEFFVDNLSNNKKIYEAFKGYAEGNAKTEQLRDDQQYYLDETMKGFKRAGLDLPDDELEKVKELKKKLQRLTQEFDRNIAADLKTITVSRNDLSGLGDDFIAQQKKADNGNYIVGVDYPTFFRVMKQCTVEGTRKKIYEAFSNRAYPENEQLLKEIIALRDKLARALGFESYSALNIDSQMAKTPQRVEAFLTDIYERAQVKADQELDALTKELPESVTLNGDGKVNVWDLAFLKNEYKKRHFAVDEEKVAEYFPMQKTVDALLDIYRQFMGVDFKEVPLSGVWHDDVRLIEVYNKNGSELYGYIFLDLHPRPHKYSHAAHAGLVPAIQLADGSRLPAASLVMANFTEPTKDKPSLLLREEVSTFFHEFGHALHAQLGATQLGSFAGTRVKTDFVEMPSQMLEEWLWDKDILKKVSSHYKTGEPLPDDLIKNIIALKRFDTGLFVTRQAFLAFLALDLYKSGTDKDPYRMSHALVERMLPRIHYGPEYRFYASFGHLTGYGAKYYGYLWSKVFALDLFDKIQQKGLLNGEIGEQYVRKILNKGGSADPNTLLRDFLGREPNKDAFIKDLGLAS